MNVISSAIDSMTSARRAVLTSHIRPDGDAIGSTLGLHRILRHAGIPSVLAGLGPIPDRYAFMMKDDIVLPAREYLPAEGDLLIVLDTGALDRAPAFVETALGHVRTLNLDHHPTNTAFADINLVDPAASSVGEMVCTLADAAGLAIPPGAAEALWMAIVTDTGRFSYSNATPAALRTAARLLDIGIPTAAINHAIYETLPAARLRLQGRAIEHLEMHHGGRLALVSLSREDFRAMNARDEDAEDIIDLPRRIGGVEVAVFLYELPGGNGTPQTKAGFRTLDPFDAAALCRRLGGGGHARSAGCSMDLPLAEARAALLAVIQREWFPA